MIAVPSPETDIVTARTARSLTVEKALQLLHVVAEQSRSVSLLALSRAANLDKTTTHRLVTSLTRYGLLRFSRERLNELVQPLIEAAGALSSVIGHRQDLERPAGNDRVQR